VLADLGADVVKVELPEGDALRRLPPFRDGAAGSEASLMFAYYHHNKRAITLDWRRDDARPLLAELGATADVVLASPSVLGERPAGFVEDEPELSWTVDGTLTCFLSPFGLTGPYRTWRATPFTLCAMSGWMYSMGPEEGPPQALPGQPLFDESGLWAAFLIQCVLMAPPELRSQVIDHSAHEVALFHQLGQSPYSAESQIKTRATNFATPPSGTWQCRDGAVEIAVHSTAQWERFLDVVGRPAPLTDPVYRDRAVRVMAFDMLSETVTGLLKDRCANDFVAAAQASGLPSSLVQGPALFALDPQARERGFFVVSDREGTGRFEMPGAPFRSLPALIEHRCPAPTLGQANEAVYVAELNHSPEELRRWRGNGLV
jgi:crotonobetainyl-CoA:carnitine CoA-transferase CaiB-like acyl-CoA transferase